MQNFHIIYNTRCALCCVECAHQLRSLRSQISCLLRLRITQFTGRQATSSQHSRCSLIQRFWETLLAQNHARTQTGAICPSLSLLAHSPLSGDPTQFTHTESHAHRKASSARRSRYSLIQRSWQTLLISLAQNQTHTESRHLPIAPVAR